MVMVASFEGVEEPCRRERPGALPGLPFALPRLLQRSAPPSRQSVALIPKWARKARAKVAADENPLSSATASTL